MLSNGLGLSLEYSEDASVIIQSQEKQSDHEDSIPVIEVKAIFLTKSEIVPEVKLDLTANCFSVPSENTNLL